MQATGTDIVTAASVSDAQIDEYNDLGFVVLRGLVSPEDTAALRGEVESIMEILSVGATKLFQTGRYVAGSAIDRLVNSPALCHIAGQLMGGPSSLYLPFTAIKTGNGGGKFNFHQDNQYTRFDGPGINMWFALVEMAVENGCLGVVPKSHLHGTYEANVLDDGHRMVKIEPEDFVPVLMQPGDCVAFTRLTVHGSGPNNTPYPRLAYGVQFHRDDVNARFIGTDEFVPLKNHPRTEQLKPVKAILENQPPEDLDGH